MRFIKKLLPIIVFALVSTVAFGQSKEDAIKAYNSALEEVKTNNYQAALTSFEKAASIAEQIGAEGEDIKQRAQDKIPTMHYQLAVQLYKNFQQSKSMSDLDAALNKFQEASTVSSELNDRNISQRANGVITQLMYQKSVLQYNNGDLDAAEQSVDQAINKNANYAVAYYHKAKIIKKKNDTNEDGIIDQNVDELIRWYDQAIQIGQATNKIRIANEATDSAHDELLAVGTKASESGNLQRAEEMLLDALQYDNESEDVYFRLAELYNKMKNSQKAITNANKALQYENGGAVDKAKIYFELGYANQTLGNKSNACSAFRNALYGSFKQPAEHKMEHELKCDSVSQSD